MKSKNFLGMKRYRTKSVSRFFLVFHITRSCIIVIIQYRKKYVRNVKRGSVIKLFRKGSQISGLDDLAAPRLMLIYAFNWLTRHDRNGSRVCLWVRCAARGEECRSFDRKISRTNDKSILSLSRKIIKGGENSFRIRRLKRRKNLNFERRRRFIFDDERSLSPDR